MAAALLFYFYPCNEASTLSAVRSRALSERNDGSYSTVKNAHSKVVVATPGLHTKVPAIALGVL